MCCTCIHISDFFAVHLVGECGTGAACGCSGRKWNIMQLINNPSVVYVSYSECAGLIVWSQFNNCCCRCHCYALHALEDWCSFLWDNDRSADSTAIQNLFLIATDTRASLCPAVAITSTQLVIFDCIALRTGHVSACRDSYTTVPRGSFDACIVTPKLTQN